MQEEKKEEAEQMHWMTEKEAQMEKGNFERRNKEAGPVGKKLTKSVDETIQGTEWVQLGSTNYTAIDLVPDR
ncbi:uncharacterized protein N7473_006022 [Penicillium subrubescens]|jgi:hypothetical protein|uniref:uncharacterized protein n=1 Tax=Penicillium subrubescens TaxID=1316194 RepID=UPI0025452160|nr:uncharacterized protein N7473_006022 [Penicillium subrubescens]KAJ5896623.1 hypothetical protein N7473_006022 [Penicillium subrubescens]